MKQDKFFRLIELATKITLIKDKKLFEGLAKK